MERGSPSFARLQRLGLHQGDTMHAIRDNAEMYLEVLIEVGDPMPWEKDMETDITGLELLSINI